MRPEPPGAEAALDPHVLEQAAEWLLRLGERDASDADRAACRHWCDQHPDHARAWARAERLRELIAVVPAALARPVLERPARADRRAAVKRLGGLLVLAPGAWLGWRLWERSHGEAILRTAVGERRRSSLADASTVDLDTDSALEIAFDPRQRLLRLQRGQVLVATAADPQRPPRAFRVATRHGCLQALGTRFNVRVGADATRVDVLDGAVRAQPAAAGALACRVEAGQTLRFDARRCGAVAATGSGVATWTQGMFSADALPLSELLDALARYRRGVLRCDPAIAALPVSGAFPLDDSERSLAMLAATYPVAIERRADGWWTTVVARRDHGPAPRR
jgi:transmembrane sensor